MIERIQELYETAVIAAGRENHFATTNMNVAEKFAEVIAYECIDLALGSSHREDDMGAIIANKIKKHFGIE